MTVRVRRTLAGLCAALALIGGGALLHAHRVSGGETVVFQTRAAGTLRERPSTAALLPHGAVNPNTSDAEALCQLPGVGPALAEAILAERQQNGFFFYPEDLLAVRGIGGKKLAGLREQLCFGVIQAPEP